MRHDPAGDLYYGNGHLGDYLEYGLVAVDPVEPDRPVARAFSAPFAFPDAARGREVRPDSGWDQVIRWAYRDRLAGVRPTAVSALEIMVAPRLQRRGVSRGDARSTARQRPPARLCRAICVAAPDREGS